MTRHLHLESGASRSLWNQPRWNSELYRSGRARQEPNQSNVRTTVFWSRRFWSASGIDDIRVRFWEMRTSSISSILILVPTIIPPPDGVRVRD